MEKQTVVAIGLSQLKNLVSEPLQKLRITTKFVESNSDCKHYTASGKPLAILLYARASVKISCTDCLNASHSLDCANIPMIRIEKIPQLLFNEHALSLESVHAAKEFHHSFLPYVIRLLDAKVKASEIQSYCQQTTQELDHVIHRSQKMGAARTLNSSFVVHQGLHLLATNMKKLLISLKVEAKFVLFNKQYRVYMSTQGEIKAADKQSLNHLSETSKSFKNDRETVLCSKNCTLIIKTPTALPPSENDKIDKQVRMLLDTLKVFD
ncbi:MAG: hypothetical protein OEX00_04650 [Gammaproteobacteria bacterium]|nr:hypothetical protein [Gammaproteobacteria bacterium]MDH5693779.1 hypothetical protein [Gammaproteobacteria bacterium]